ncbi:MAG: polyprenyl diphosphate synthase [bacterium]|nr:polyprenyl diphosphate synthase [bacterium]
MNIIRHIAIIPDGNRRWAREKNLLPLEGHRKGAEQMIALAKKIKELQIPVVSFWAFSTENWNRTKNEVEGLMILFSLMFKQYFDSIIKNKIRFIHIGRKDRLNKQILKSILELEEKSKHFTNHYFVLAMDYGGRDEVIRAINKIQNSQVKIQNINEENFNQFLDTRDVPYPYPDLIIRTSGEMRTSGFMIWQAAYSEYIFSKKYFPDFSPQELQLCIDEFLKRQRRFGA